MLPSALTLTQTVQVGTMTFHFAGLLVLQNLAALSRRALAAFGLLLFGSIMSVISAETVAITHANIYTAAKAGFLEDATVLIVDGRIADVGTSVTIPLNARIIDGSGKWVIPGIVDPYYVVRLGAPSEEQVRTVVFQGRTFVIGGGSPAVRTSLLDVAEVFDSENADWNEAIRSGITTMHLVTDGYCYTAVAKPVAGSADETFLQRNSHLHVAATNSSQALELIRKGLEKPAENRGSGSPSGRTGQPSSDQTEQKPSDSRKTWEEIREGKSPLFVNAENSAAILHVFKLREKAEKAAIVMTATGANLYQTLESLNAPRTTILLTPEIDRMPNSAIRINVPAAMQKQKIPFAISLSSASSQFRRSQDTPLFPLAMLVRTGLAKDTALESITINSAKAIGMESLIGSIEKGKYGNLVVLNGEPFATYTQVEHVILEGKIIRAQ
jgi:imidazolonepropionase-like amidohydrolase